MDSGKVNEFIQRWQDGGGTERANYQLFLTELCTLLTLDQPDPAQDDTRDNAYVFERRVTESFAEGGDTKRFIDLYKRGSFVCEAKQSGLKLETGRWDKAMRKAFNQAEGYVRALPAEEGRPPFIIVTDVGRHLELYSEFSRSGGNYTAYPDANSFRIKLEDLRKPEVQQRLIAVWNTPMDLDPSRVSARVTREIADKLAELAKSLEADNHSPEQTSGFLMRCLFTMFAEDVGLLPHRSFTELLIRLEDHKAFAPMLKSLWATMNTGGFSPIIEDDILKFNGGLFAEAEAIELDREQRQLLIEAAKSDWRYVEPAIFGTLLERALDPRERHKLGAHYTPRSYVERLVMPTIIEPLREQWENVQAAAVALENKGKHKDAVAEIRAFHQQLCNLRVLDPACGSGNFLYVTLEHMKRLEGDVLNLLHELGESQGLLEMEGVTVDPHQFLGIEINPRAAKVAEMVLWIGYLQWHFRTYGNSNPPEPVLRDFHNIENRDALIEYDSRSEQLDANGQPVTIWDGLTMKTSPVTGELIPDENARIPVYQYQNPRQTHWPEADYIVGNPPFIGASTMRRALGDGYVDAVRKVFKGTVPESADFVMFWWHIAAEKVRLGQGKAGAPQQFGFITTNSLRQTFNRRVLEPHLNDPKKPLSLAFAIPDHPWVDASDGAAVRIAMTVGVAGEQQGRLLTSLKETETQTDEIKVDFQSRQGKLFADLKIGADVASTKALNANECIGFRGVTLMGSGFWVQPEDELLLKEPGALKPLRNGRDITSTPRFSYVIDLFGLSEKEARDKFPNSFQRILNGVKPERDQSKRDSYRKKWWVFAEARPEMRNATHGLDQICVSPMTAKHRFWVPLDSKILPDQGLIVLAVESSELLGVLSSRCHIAFALAAGGSLGVGNDPRYNNSRCFETFPFPDLFGPEKEKLATRIGELAEQIDQHRKTRQAAHDKLTLTGIYNVLEKLRKAEPLTAKEKTIYDDGLVGILRELHDELDRAVFEAYGWDDLAEKLVGLPGATTPYPEKSEAQADAEEELLKRLVALNHQRAAEEAKGQIRWLRPEYQNPDYGKDGASANESAAQVEADVTVTPTASKAKKLTWPKSMPEQVAAVKTALQDGLDSVEAITVLYKSPKSTGPKVQEVLESLESLGYANREGGRYWLVG
ncbi:MAG: SAM-dependent methyltransferase [Oceanospirillaceae bacterium]|nr:SAM-dependent methyltransferase [Oceanospirillaceae bacterium]